MHRILALSGWDLCFGINIATMAFILPPRYTFFCVGFIVDEADEVASIGGEVTLLDSHFDMTMSRQTRRQARIAANRKDSKPVTKNPTAKPRKRVIHRVDSSSEEEMDLPSTQTLMGVGVRIQL